MFSTAERTFLQILASSTGEAQDLRLESAFPNPVYRRKLLWGIRQKAGSSFEDWMLYARATRNEPRLLPRSPETPPEATPIFTDPLAAFLLGIRRSLSRRTRREDPGSLRASRGR